jgi:tetratricopeptide (TPR) repeat protein
MNIATDSILSMKYSNSFNEAVTSYNKALEISEDWKEDIYSKLFQTRIVQVNKAVNYYERKQYDLAGNEFMKSAMISSILKQQDSIIGADAFNSGRCFKLALNPLCVPAYKQCIDLKYNAFQSYLDILSFYKQIGDSISEIKYIKEARSVFPEDANLLVVEADYYLRLKQFGEVNTLFRDIVKVNPNDDVIIFQWGVVYEKLDSIGKAMECYERALVINPQNKDALYNKCRLLLFEARDFARNCDNKRGEPYVKCMDELKLKFLKLSDDYLLLYQMFPEDAQVKKILQECYRKSGQPEKATELK